MSDAKPERTKVNFVLLKQILDDQETVSSTDEINTAESDSSKLTEELQNVEDTELESEVEKEVDNSGPVGKYPVVFSKRCRSKSCQTRLSAFPLFSVPEETEWISDGEETTRIKRSHKKGSEKRRTSKPKQAENCINDNDGKTNKKKAKSKDTKVKEVVTSKTKNLDGSRKTFASEHQLKETVNPVLRAWIHQKNKLARKMRREERKEKRAKRLALEEEYRIHEERKVESEKSVHEWLKIKRKEARRAWRQTHPKVNPFDMGETTADPTFPLPDYTVVKSFQFSQPIPSKSESQIQNAGKVADASIGRPEDPKGMGRKKKTKRKVIDVKPQSEQGPRYFRPKSAAANLDARESRTEGDKIPRQRPKTAKGNLSSENVPEKMQSMTYDDWLKQKREQDKKKSIQKKREIIDSHLDAVVAELGKQRVERILSPKKHVDTGLKNYKKTPEKREKSPSAVRKDSPYRWATERKVPRPEPQGCDCPEADHPDVATNVVGELNRIEQTTPSGSASPSTLKKQAVTFCKEVTDQCDELKPSMEKVLAVLDTEIKKTNEKKVSKALSEMSTTGATAGSDAVSIESDLLASDSILRPKSARPKSAKVTNTKLTAEQVRQKIEHDMDILGLCETEDKSAKKTDSTEKSTIRENYFDYGSDVDPPTTMKSPTPLS